MKKVIFFLSLAVSAVTIVLLLNRSPAAKPYKPTAPIAEKAQKIIEIDALCQYPALPTGCEATAAATVLRFLGSDITPEQFANDWLERDPDFYYSGGMLCGPDPNKVFAGDPFSDNSFGCYSGAIERAINKNGGGFSAETVESQSLWELCGRFIDKDTPVIIWATIGMKESAPGRSWLIDGKDPFTWISGEHCLVLIGYNEDYFFFSDPQSGSIVAYQKAISEKRFYELGRQALIINKTPSQ